MVDMLTPIKTIVDESVPTRLHNRIMWALFYRKYRLVFFSAFTLITLNLAVSVWRLWVRLIETDFVSMLRSLGESFEVSRSFMSDAAGEVWSALPLSALISSLVSTVLLAYLAFIYFGFQKLKEVGDYQQN